MKKWLLTIIIGFFLFVVTTLILFYLNEHFVGQVAVWELQAHKLGFKQSLGLAMSRFIENHKPFLVLLNSVFWAGVCVIAKVVFRKDKAGRKA
ncbi:MAG: hypothetical protein ABII18_06625 [bacterium]